MKRMEAGEQNNSDDAGHMGNLLDRAGFGKTRPPNCSNCDNRGRMERGVGNAE